MTGMATRKTTAPPEEFEEHIVDIDVGEEMRSSFLEYAYSVIYSRALPDARDGLKPVQRRILYTMNDMNLRPDRGHVKSARVVGEVMGRLHPHGDTAIYDALVRMAQPWSMRLPFIDGHGNFGSPDDGPAAMRYTECRMDHSAVAMTASINEDTVDFKSNYDGRETEPVVQVLERLDDRVPRRRGALLDAFEVTLEVRELALINLQAEQSMMFRLGDDTASPSSFD